MMEDDNVKLNAINSGLATTNYMVYQFKYNTIHCRYPSEVGWAAIGADYVCESTGIFLTKETVQAIITGSAKEVVSSAPPPRTTPRSGGGSVQISRGKG